MKLIFPLAAGVVATIIISLGGYFILLENNNNQSNSQHAVLDDASTTSDAVMITDGKKHLVPLSKIKSGGPPKDGIPSIDEPKFAKASEAEFMADSDVVIGLEINGEKRAYPLFILVWHEIVNDSVGEIPVAVTYCPLCFTNQVFERTIDGKAVEFGTSGKLYNSNLVMYDRLTDSYWSQALGKAIVGELTGSELRKIPFDVMKWKDWKQLHPDTLVLTTDTGYIRSYATDPYGNYYTDSRIMFPVDNKDDRLHPKELIVGFDVDNKVYKAYKQEEIERTKIINDSVGDKKVLVISLYDDNARIFERVVDGKKLEFEYVDGKITDTTTNSMWDYAGKAISGPLKGKQLKRMPIDPGFWFEWVAFHPNTEIHQTQ